MDGTLSTALGGSFIRVFTAVRIEIGEDPICLVSGSGQVTFPVNGTAVTFTSKDAVFGTLNAVSSINESIATSAPRLQVSLLPPSNSAVGALSAPLAQGSRVYVWIGIVSEATGLVVGTPELVWSGRLETAKTTVVDTGRVVELDVASAFDRLFITSEAARLNRAWHQSIWAGETGLDFNVDSLVDPMWGAEAATKAQPTNTAPRPVVATPRDILDSIFRPNG